jgi:hypothetical protein
VVPVPEISASTGIPGDAEEATAAVAHWLQRRGFEIAILLHDFSL